MQREAAPQHITGRTCNTWCTLFYFAWVDWDGTCATCIRFVRRRDRLTILLENAHSRFIWFRKFIFNYNTRATPFLTMILQKDIIIKPKTTDSITPKLPLYTMRLIQFKHRLFSNGFCKGWKGTLSLLHRWKRILSKNCWIDQKKTCLNGESVEGKVVEPALVEVCKFSSPFLVSPSELSSQSLKLIH